MIVAERWAEEWILSLSTRATTTCGAVGQHVSEDCNTNCGCVPNMNQQQVRVNQTETHKIWLGKTRKRVELPVVNQANFPMNQVVDKRKTYNYQQQLYHFVGWSATSRKKHSSLRYESLVDTISGGLLVANWFIRDILSSYKLPSWKKTNRNSLANSGAKRHCHCGGLV